MTLTEVIAAAALSDSFAIRCADWPVGQHVSVERMDQKMMFHRHADSVICWSWSPTPNQLLAEKWEVYVAIQPTGV